MNDLQIIVRIRDDKLGQAFEAAARLPRVKQEKVIALLEAFVDQHSMKGELPISNSWSIRFTDIHPT